MQVLQFCLFTVEGRIRLLQMGKDYARIVGICLAQASGELYPMAIYKNRRVGKICRKKEL